MSLAMLVTWVFAGLLVGSLARVLMTGGPGLIRDLGLGLGGGIVASAVLKEGPRPMTPVAGRLLSGRGAESEEAGRDPVGAPRWGSGREAG